MRRIAAVIIFITFSVCLLAQTEKGTAVISTDKSNGMPDTLSVISGAIPPSAQPVTYAEDTNILNLPTLTYRGKMPMPLGYYNMFGSLPSWNLHEGLNVSLGASVFSTFGSGNTWSGAGFSQSVSLMYAMPLSQNLSLSVGGYFGNMSWAHSSWQDAGMSAVLGYQFDEHWSAYLYGQKSFVQSQPIPAHLRDMSDLGDRIGVAVRYNFSPAFAVQLSFDAVEVPVYSPVPMPVMRGKMNDMRQR